MSASYGFILGIDISKKTLDYTLLSSESKLELKQGKVENNSNGIRELTKLALQPGTLTGFEATGYYGFQLSESLSKAGADYTVLNPRSTHHYSKLKLKRSKTDKSDSKLIAEYCNEQEVTLRTDIGKVRKEMKALVATERNFIKMITQQKNLRESIEMLGEYAQTSISEIEVMIDNYQESLKRIEERLKKLAYEEYENEIKLLKGIKGIGDKTAVAIVLYCGDFSTFTNSKQVVAYAGLSPNLKESGTSKKQTYGITKEGNALLRTLLFMGAISASKFNTSCRKLYERLRAKGKSWKSAIVAVACKLLRQSFGVIKNNSPFVDDFKLNIA